MMIFNPCLKGFEHDHETLFKHSKEDNIECILLEPQITDKVPSNSLAEVSGQESIPVEGW